MVSSPRAIPNEESGPKLLATPVLGANLPVSKAPRDAVHTENEEWKSLNVIPKEEPPNPKIKKDVIRQHGLQSKLRRNSWEGTLL